MKHSGIVFVVGPAKPFKCPIGVTTNGIKLGDLVGVSLGQSDHGIELRVGLRGLTHLKMDDRERPRPKVV